MFIGLGSNEGDRRAHLTDAALALGALPAVRLLRMATIIKSDPLGGPPQGPYLNTVAELNTTLSPRELLEALQRVERQLGRQSSGPRWGPRPIDLDLLLYDDAVIDEPDLRVPHPRMPERWFVLQPLAELAPQLIHPVLQETIRELFDRLKASVP